MIAVFAKMLANAVQCLGLAHPGAARTLALSRSTAGQEPSPERLPIDQRTAFDTASEASGKSEIRNSGYAWNTGILESGILNREP